MNSLFPIYQPSHAYDFALNFSSLRLQVLNLFPHFDSTLGSSKKPFLQERNWTRYLYFGEHDTLPLKPSYLKMRRLLTALYMTK